MKNDFKLSPVSARECKEYDFEKLKNVLSKSFDDLGGIEKFINKGDRVLLKVNLVMMKRPDAAATSDPVFTAALASLIMEYGAEVIIGDSPGGPFKETLLRGVYKVCDMNYAAQKSGASLNYDVGFAEVDFPDGKRLKKIAVTNMVLNADKVISVARLKTHGMMRFTAAVKNMFGVVPGTKKAECHFTCQDDKSFAECLVDICLKANPTLAFVDAITAMEGNGPTAGEPRDIGLVFACASPYCLDLAAASVITDEPQKIPTIAESFKRGLCPKTPEELSYAGADIKKYKVSDFKIPQQHSLYFLGKNPPKFLKDFVNLRVQPRPVVNYKKCVGCADCAKNCPAKTIDMTTGKPKIRLENCIRCFCCQELCPKEAIDIKRPVIFKILSKF